MSTSVGGIGDGIGDGIDDGCFRQASTGHRCSLRNRPHNVKDARRCRIEALEVINIIDDDTAGDFVVVQNQKSRQTHERSQNETSRWL